MIIIIIYYSRFGVSEINDAVFVPYFRCSDCDYAAYDLACLKSHNQLFKHGDQKPEEPVLTSFSQCESDFGSQPMIPGDDQPSSSSSATYRCTVCPKVFHTHKQLEVHMHYHEILKDSSQSLHTRKDSKNRHLNNLDVPEKFKKIGVFVGPKRPVGRPRKIKGEKIYKPRGRPPKTLEKRKEWERKFKLKMEKAKKTKIMENGDIMEERKSDGEDDPLLEFNLDENDEDTCKTEMEN